MLLMKLAGSLLVLVASSVIGLAAAWRLKERCEQLQHLLHCLGALAAYIEGVALPLPAALRQCTLGVQGPVACLFKDMARVMERDSRLSPAQAFVEAKAAVQSALCWRSEETAVLERCMATLGDWNTTEQLNQLALARRQLQLLWETAQCLYQRNSKLYRYLGVCAGTSVILIAL